MKAKEIKRTSDKKGISLIVLVITIIVIIILAVAVILSIANNNPIENAKEARFKNDVKAMQEELELLKASNYAKNNGASYNNPETGDPIELSDLTSSTNYQGKFNVKDGELKYIAGNLTGEEIKLALELGVEERILKIEDEVTYQGEPFYILGGDTVGTIISADTHNIILLSKYNLTSDGIRQDKTGAYNSCVFSSTNYWRSIEGITYPANLNDVEKYPIPDTDTQSVIKKAKAYGEALGVTGRLMTYEEAKILEKSYQTFLFGTYSRYWLGSTYGETTCGRCKTWRTV